MITVKKVVQENYIIELSSSCLYPLAKQQGGRCVSIGGLTSAIRFLQNESMYAEIVRAKNDVTFFGNVVYIFDFFLWQEKINFWKAECTQVHAFQKLILTKPQGKRKIS